MLHVKVFPNSNPLKCCVKYRELFCSHLDQQFDLPILVNVNVVFKAIMGLLILKVSRIILGIESSNINSMAPILSVND